MGRYVFLSAALPLSRQVRSLSKLMAAQEPRFNTKQNVSFRLGLVVNALILAPKKHG